MRSRLAFAALLSISLLTLPSAGASASEETGTVRISAAPKQIVMNQAYEWVRYSLSGVYYSSDRYEWCNVTVENKATRASAGDDMPDEYQYDGNIQINSYNIQPGVHQVIADCYWAGRAVDEILIKWGSTVRLNKATRRGNRVVVTGKVRRYSESSQYLPWRRAKVVVQRKQGSAWKTVKTVTADKKGAISTSVRASKRAQWRLMAKETSAAWSSASRAIRR